MVGGNDPDFENPKRLYNTRTQPYVTPP